MRTLRFTFLCSVEERKLIALLAETLQRSQSEALRWLVREAVLEIYSQTASKKVENRKDSFEGEYVDV